MGTRTGVVLLGDVVAARPDPAVTAAWLRELAAELDELYATECLAPFSIVRGGELQGLLEPSADPFRAVLQAMLRPDHRDMRWVAARGAIGPGDGPAAERVGGAFLAASDALERARRDHETFLIVTGAGMPDRLLADLTPVLANLLDRLTDRQRVVARLALLDGLRQAEVADRLGVRRATVSISFSRAGVGSLRRLLSAGRLIYEAALRDGAVEG